jgi:hypothetical protein
MSDGAMTEAELSQASGAGPELLRRLVALGIVPARDGSTTLCPGTSTGSGSPRPSSAPASLWRRSARPSRPAGCRSPSRPEALNEQLLTQGARLFGEATSRLADWGMALYRAYFEAPMLAAGLSAQEAMDASSAFARVGTRSWSVSCRGCAASSSTTPSS